MLSILRCPRVVSARCVLIAVLCTWLSVSAQAESLMVATASNFSAPMKAITGRFEQETGHTVTLAFGSSGRFYAQIKNGAPFQVFFSADQEKPLRLEEEGIAVQGSRYTYAVGSVALWSARPDFVDSDGAVLKAAQFEKLALANPRLAPYGLAAQQVLEKMGLYQPLQGKLVQGENITQAWQFILSGNAELGFVALSQVMQQGKLLSGSVWIVPENLYQPIRQDAVLLRAGKNNPAAQALLDYVRRTEIKMLIASYGYRTDKGD